MTETCIKLEQSLVGSLMVSPDSIVNIADKIRPTDFTDQRAQAVFTAIMSKWTEKLPVDQVSMFSSIPGMAVYIAEAVDSAFPPSIKSFTAEIAERARTRRVKAGLEAASKSNGADGMLADAMAVYKHEMAVGRKDPAIKAILSRFGKIVKKNQQAGKVGFSTGFDLHGKMYYRYFPGHIWSVGGFTSAGKTAVMVQKICNMLTNGEGAKILVISTEMSEEQVISRIISNFTSINSLRILSGNYHSAEEEDSVASVKEQLKQAPLTIYDDIYQLTDIETAFRKAELQGGINVGFIDYVQNCRWTEAKSQYQEQAEMAKRFQALAKEVKATIICLSQVSNDVGRGNTDQLELKGAGEWAAVSDLGVMLIRNQKEKYQLKYSVKKNRHGPLVERVLEFKNDYTKLEELPAR